MPLFKVIVSRKNSEKGYVNFQKNSGKGYNVWKKFQIGSVILMTQMTNQKKTELTNDFNLVWTKNSQFWENFLENAETIHTAACENIMSPPPRCIGLQGIHRISRLANSSRNFSKLVHSGDSRQFPKAFTNQLQPSPGVRLCRPISASIC